jgi:hypothetical protein
MGWKSVKEHYRIKHTVCVTEQGICIGSTYIHDIIVIGLDGKLKKRDSGGSNDDLKRYMREFDADPKKLKSLVEAEDEFEKSVKVYTYDYDGNILEKQCEEPGWPNSTHDGEMMYDNKFSTKRREVVKLAKQELRAAVRMMKDLVDRKRQDLSESESGLSRYEAALKKLESNKR